MRGFLTIEVKLKDHFSNNYEYNENTIFRKKSNLLSEKKIGLFFLALSHMKKAKEQPVRARKVFCHVLRSYMIFL